MKSELYSIEGVVVKGTRYGTVLGFPTANLNKSACLKSTGIPLGVYAGVATIDEQHRHRAGIVIGPIGKDALPKIEAHLLDFSGDIYGKAIRLSLLDFLRPFKDFVDDSDLKKQIAADVEKVRSMISL